MIIEWLEPVVPAHSSPPVRPTQVVRPSRQKRHHFLSICAAGYALHKHTVPSLPSSTPSPFPPLTHSQPSLLLCLTLHSFSCLMKETMLSPLGLNWMIFDWNVYWPKSCSSCSSVPRRLFSQAGTHTHTHRVIFQKRLSCVSSFFLKVVHIQQKSINISICLWVSLMLSFWILL